MRWPNLVDPESFDKKVNKWSTFRHTENHQIQGQHNSLTHRVPPQFWNNVMKEY
jgi:hypothetical protein